jgi:hypothetical protein
MALCRFIAFWGSTLALIALAKATSEPEIVADGGKLHLRAPSSGDIAFSVGQDQTSLNDLVNKTGLKVRGQSLCCKIVYGC